MNFKKKIITINIISIILAIILIVIIIVIGLNNYYLQNNNKNKFYGDPPGRQKAVGLSDLGDDRGWASFSCYTQQGFDIDCNQLNGHQGTTPSAMVKYEEFGEKYN